MIGFLVVEAVGATSPLKSDAVDGAPAAAVVVAGGMVNPVKSADLGAGANEAGIVLEFWLRDSNKSLFAAGAGAWLEGTAKASKVGASDCADVKSPKRSIVEGAGVTVVVKETGEAKSNKSTKGGVGADAGAGTGFILWKSVLAALRGGGAAQGATCA